MVNNLIVDGVKVVSGGGNNGRVHFSAFSTESKTKFSLAYGFNSNLQLEKLEGGLQLSNDNTLNEGLIGKLSQPELFLSLYAQLPISSDGKRRYDYVESASLFWLSSEFPKENFGYLRVQISEIPELRVKISERCDYIVSVDAQDFYVPIAKKELGLIKGLIKNGDVFAHIKPNN